MISQFFAPSRIVLSFADESGVDLDPELFVTRDPVSMGGDGTGKVTGLKLPDRSIFISNHQIYLDWLYTWIVAYYANLADAIYIVLKASLKWTPIVGPAMQFYRFVFMQRKWEQDKHSLSDHLAFLAEQSRPYHSHTSNASSVDAAAAAAPNKLLLVLFPEGTLVSTESRPGSKKYADKIGEPDCRNMVLPRSTGLFYCLRTLAAEIADLKLIDATIGYPGIPPAGVGQRHYTLRSVYMDGVAPPNVHIHLTISRISSFVGSSASDSPPLGKLPHSAKASPELLPTDEEKAAFEAWLLRRWRKKDDLLDRFYADGDFVGGAFARTAAAGEYRRPSAPQLESAPNGAAPAKAAKKDSASPTATKEAKWVELPTELQSPLELGHVFCWFAPVIAIWLGWKAVRIVTG